MELNELKNVWKQQSSNHNLDYSQSELMMLINNQMISLEKEIKSRDRIEFIACLFLIVCFGIILFTTNSVWKQVGSVTIVLSGIFIWYKLKYTQHRSFDKKPSPDRPMREYLKLEAESVEKQKKLLQNIAWWYIAPICLGLFFFALGLDSGFTKKLLYMIVVIVTGGLVWWMNQRAVKQKFDPLLKEIKEAIKFLEED
ncbi:MAG TPA: hypothetical protein VJ964_08170 [Balneolaceae bacterium]|nr:hypothetical protein [Balneolaceae bacterium]